MIKHESKIDWAVNHLRNLGWKVEKLSSGEYRASSYPFTPWNETYTTYTVRELIKLAKSYTHENRQNTTIKKITKQEATRERSFVRDEIRKMGEDADVCFPKRKYADSWNWD